MSLLAVDDLDAGYGDFRALSGLSIHLDEGERVAVIGANGAGKSTLLRAVTGQVRITGGRITLRGRDLAGVHPHRRALEGVALVPEGRRLFPSLSVTENLQIGAYGKRPGHWDLDAVVGLFPMLGPLLGRRSDTLSGGERQAVAIGRALMSNPDVLLLDEVSLGLAPRVVRELYAVLPQLSAQGCSLLIVEQDISQALAAADRVYCLLEGQVSLAGRPGDLAHDDITAAYFGV